MWSIGHWIFIECFTPLPNVWVDKWSWPHSYPHRRKDNKSVQGDQASIQRPDSGCDWSGGDARWFFYPWVRWHKVLFWLLLLWFVVSRCIVGYHPLVTEHCRLVAIILNAINPLYQWQDTYIAWNEYGSYSTYTLSIFLLFDSHNVHPYLTDHVHCPMKPSYIGSSHQSNPLWGWLGAVRIRAASHHSFKAAWCCHRGALTAVLRSGICKPGPGSQYSGIKHFW